MPKGISAPSSLLVGMPDLRISSTRARFSSSITSCRRTDRLVHHSLDRPARKTKTIPIASTCNVLGRLRLAPQGLLGDLQRSTAATIANRRRRSWPLSGDLLHLGGRMVFMMVRDNSFDQQTTPFPHWEPASKSASWSRSEGRQEFGAPLSGAAL
jgi:hypothetical protein